MQNTIALITPNLNPHVMGDYIESINKQQGIDLHVYIVNISNLKDAYPHKFTKPTSILDTPNKGFANAVNTGLKRAVYDGHTMFCVINDDTYFKPDFARQVAEVISNHPRALLGGKIYYAPGFEYHKDRYSKKDRGHVLWYAGGIMDWKNAYTLHRGVDEVDHGQYDTFMATEFITGCLAMFDKGVIDRVGYWDESYFLYYEDAEYGERAKDKGVALYYDPSVSIWHKVSQSTGGSGSSIHTKYQRINRLRFGLQYAPWRTKVHLLKNYFISSR